MDDNNENTVEPSNTQSSGIVEQPTDRLPKLVVPRGHNRLKPDTYHGQLTITLTALEPLHVGTGVLVLGNDLGDPAPLVSPMTQQIDGTLIIPGTSLKGCLRSMYEAITPSALGVVKRGWPKSLGAFEPKKYRENQKSICPASQIFGAMGYQGLLSVGDAVGDRKAELGTMPALYTPQPQKINAQATALPRRFYRPFYQRSNDTPATQRDTKKPTTIQQAPVGTRFTSQLRFKNLTLEEIGLLLIVLGQHPDQPLLLKLGMGKGYGFGTVQTNIKATAVYNTKQLTAQRYQTYKASAIPQTDLISRALQKALAPLSALQTDQLDQLYNILPRPKP